MPMSKADRIQRQLDAMNDLYATGPWTTQFFQWVDQSLTVLGELFGERSDEVRAFLLAAGDDIHDPAAVMIPIHTEWGTHARMARCRVVLESVLSKLKVGAA
jgi:hypothetical protein